MPYVAATVTGVSFPAPSQHDSGGVRGACPSVHAPFGELDGALMRVRLPGGRLSTSAARTLAAIADDVGAGPFELTNRANLQLRAIPIDAVPDVRDALVAAGIAPADAGADERRNVLASPTAGVDVDELVDTGPLVSAIADRLAAARHGVPSHKFGVIVDGGGAVHVRGRRHDVAFGALQDVDGAVRYEVRLAGALPMTRHPDETVTVVDPGDVMDVVDAAIAGRGAECVLATRSVRELTTPIGPSLPAVGAHAQRQDGKVWIGAVPMLGRLDAPTLDQLAQLAGPELRLTPWRGVVLFDVSTADTSRVTSCLERLGLIVDPEHPASTVVACAGRSGCAAGLSDTQADARVLIDRLKDLPVSRRPRSVHVSGCEKGCARAQPAEVSLVAGPTRGCYDLYSGAGAEHPRFGVLLTSGMDEKRAIGAVVSYGPQP